jgi:phosphatidylethanolamine/phosphatidyl-N-methylethanolamine N-methyltransferase
VGESRYAAAALGLAGKKRRRMGYLTDIQAFFREFRRQYQNTGSILPSGKALGRALVGPMNKAPSPRRILEVGPGTGAVTREIVARLRPGDHLDIVEINERFVAHLRERFETEPIFRRRRQQARLIHAPLQDVPGQAAYDFVISGLPLNNFSVPLVRDIFKAYRRLVKPDGIVSYFEYALIRDLKLAFLRGRKRKQLMCLDHLLKRYIRAYQIGEEAVLWNVPPAIVGHFRFRES